MGHVSSGKQLLPCFIPLFFVSAVGTSLNVSVCAVTAGLQTFNLSDLVLPVRHVSRELGSEGWVYTFSACGDVLPSNAGVNCGSAAPHAGALQQTIGACYSIGASATREVVAADHGLNLTFSGGDRCGSEGEPRQARISIQCDDVPRPRVLFWKHGSTSCSYEALVSARAGCAISCARDGFGAVCGGKRKGTCTADKVEGRPRCVCASGRSGATCEVQIQDTPNDLLLSLSTTSGLYSNSGNIFACISALVVFYLFCFAKRSATRQSIFGKILLSVPLLCYACLIGGDASFSIAMTSLHTSASTPVSSITQNKLGFSNDPNVYTNEAAIHKLGRECSSNGPLVTVVGMFIVTPTRKHSLSDYEVWMASYFESVTAPLVLYVAGYSIDRFLELRGNRPIIIHELQDVWDLPHAREMRTDYEGEQWRLDPERNIHIPELYALWNAKAGLLDIVAEENPFCSRYFMYADVGMFRTGPLPPWPDEERVLQVYSRQPHAMAFFLVRPFSTVQAHASLFKAEMPQYKDAHWRRTDLVGGAWFGGQAAAVRQYSRLFYEIVCYTTPAVAGVMFRTLTLLSFVRSTQEHPLGLLSGKTRK